VLSRLCAGKKAQKRGTVLLLLVQEGSLKA